MNIREMHYDFKMKFNKLDSQKNRNLQIPEIDWYLNSAEKLLIKLIAFPREKSNLGFEINQRTIEDIRTVVKTSEEILIQNNIVTLPLDYEYFLKAVCLISKGNCKNVRARFHPSQHDDMNEESLFYSSSFEWREIYGVFNENGIEILKDNSFNVDSIKISYIRKRKYMHNAQDFRNGTYTDLKGNPLTGFQDSELPELIHPDIVDLAVFLAESPIVTQDVNRKAQIIGLNGLK